MARTIRTRLFNSFLAAFLVVLALLSVVLLFGLPGHPEYGGLPREREQVTTSLTIEADSRQDRVMRWLEERRGDIYVNSHSAPVADDVIALERALATLGPTAPTGSASWDRLRATPPGQRLTDLLRTMRETYRDYHALVLVEAHTGRVVAADRPVLLGADLTQDPAVREVLRTRAEVISPVHQSLLEHAPVVSFSGPVEDAGGAPIAVLMGECPLEHIAASVFTVDRELGQTGESFLVNSDGTNLHRLKYPPKGSTPPAPLTYRIDTPQVKLALAGRSGVMESRDYRGAPVLVAYRYLPVTPQWGWGMIVKQDLAESYAAVRARVLFTLALVLCGLLAFAGLASVVSRRLSAPLVSLTRTAREVSAGNLAARTSVATQDEIGTLAGTFNSLVAGVEERQASLERERERMALLAGTAAQLLATDSPLHAVNDLCRRVMAFLDCQVFFNYLADERVGRLHLNAYAGIPEEAARDIGWLDYGVAVCGCVAQEGCRIVAEHLPTTPDPRTDLVKSFGVTAYACHPILSGEQVLGTLSFGTTTRETFTEDELALMKAVTDQVAIAVVRQQAEQAVRESEFKYRELVQNANNVIIRWRRDGTITFFNEYAQEFFGYREEEALGRDVRMLVPGEDSAGGDLRVLVEAIVAHPEAFAHNVNENVRRDGSRVWMAWTNRPLFDAAGELAEVLAVGTDITARVRAEEALRESELRMSALLNAAGESIWLFGADGTVLAANETAARRVGYRVEEVVGKPWAELIPPRLAESRGQKIEEVLRANAPVYFEDERAGLTFDHSFYPVRDGAGRALAVAAFSRDVTARRQAEEAIRRQAALIDLSPDAIIVRGADAAITLWSRGAEAMYGWTREEAIGRMTHVLLETEFPLPMREIEQQLADAGRWSGELRHHTKDGRSIVVQSWWLARFDAQGEIREVLETNVDVSERVQAAQVLEQQVQVRTRELAASNESLTYEVAERRRAEEELRAASLYARSLLEASLDPLVTISPEGKITDVNAATVTVTGVPREQLIGTDFSDYFTEPERARAGYQQVFSQGYVTDYPLTLRHRDGRLIHVLYNASLYRDVAGNVQGVFAAARDVTAQRQSTQYARSLLEASLDPLVTISPEGTITDVNEATVQVTGVPRYELVGTDFSEYFTEPERAREGYRQVFSQGYVTDYPLTVRHREGRLTDVLYNATVYRDVDGEVQGVFAAARDVTERNRAEAEIRRLNQELEQRVIQRTAQLQAAMAEMEAFTYSVSHDLRAPLRAMDGFSLALLDDHREELSQEGMLYLNRIRGASQRMGQLIDDLLQLSRVTRGEMQRTEVDLSAAARAIAAELQEGEPTRAVAFAIADELHVQGDARLLEQVLRNLLDNAWKFTRKHPTARIEFGMTEQAGEPVFFVRDDGAGFNMAYAGKLFQIFQRLHGMEEFEGTGIGLVTVSRIVQRHGGRVWAEGAPERGAAFYFTLPYQSQSPAQSGAEQRAWTRE